MDQLPTQPQENGTSPGACVEQQQHHLLQKLLDSESKYQLASEELQVLRTQQTTEKEQVNPRISLEFLFFSFVCSRHFLSWLVSNQIMLMYGTTDFIRASSTPVFSWKLPLERSRCFNSVWKRTLIKIDAHLLTQMPLKLYRFFITRRWRATSHTSVAFWKNGSVRPPSMNKRTSSCGKSFTTSDNNKVNCAQMLPVK